VWQGRVLVSQGGKQQIIGCRNPERIELVIAIVKVITIWKSVILNPTRQCRFVINGCPCDAVVPAARHGNANSEGKAVLKSKPEALEQAATFICIW
jgi:hypothetical protein